MVTPASLPILSSPLLLLAIIVSTPLLTHLTTAFPSPQQPTITIPTTSPYQQTPTPLQNTNLTTPSTASLTNPTNLTGPPSPGAQCRLSGRWSTPSFDAFDCLQNLENLWIHRVIGDENTAYEFLAYGVQQRTRLMGVRLPMKWVFST